MTSLSDMPDELTLEVISHFRPIVPDTIRDRYESIPRTFQMLTALSSVNWQLRRVVLPYTFSFLRVSEARLPAMLRLYSDSLHLIRFLVVVSCPSDFPTSTRYQYSLQWSLSALVGLRTLDVATRTFCPRLVQGALGPIAARLVHLSIGWNAATPFPFAVFPALVFLRVHIRDRHWRVGRLSGRYLPHSIDSLTHLHVVDDQGWFPRFVRQRYVFPNLQVFRYRTAPTSRSYDVAFDFVCAHTSLRIVEMQDVDISFEGFCGLACRPSAGHWSAPTGGDRTVILDCMLDAFAYRLDDAGIVTDVSLTFHGGRTSAPQVLDDQDIDSIPAFLPACKRLDLTFVGKNTLFLEHLFVQRFRPYACLEHLELTCAVPWCDYEFLTELFDWDPLDDFAEESFLEHARELYDDEDIMLDTLADRMNIWRDAACEEVRWYVEQLASNVPTLKTFVWTLARRDLLLDVVEEGELDAPFWRWTIARSETAVSAVSSSFTWRGHISHEPRSSRLSRRFE
ncbi:hypothetical protein MKEN_00114400 [Mycena kentingensis (nom. inval.)]|nr:hypothetical protein MKEN_00114400 [Mycena kentingensis (nom. inval.)]